MEGFREVGCGVTCSPGRDRGVGDWRAGQTSQGKGQEGQPGLLSPGWKRLGRAWAGSLGLVPVWGPSAEAAPHPASWRPTLLGPFLLLRLRSSAEGRAGESRPRPRVTPSLNGGQSWISSPSRRRGAGPLAGGPGLGPAPGTRSCPWTRVLQGVALWQPPITAPLTPVTRLAEEGRCDNWPGFLNLGERSSETSKALAMGTYELG